LQLPSSNGVGSERWAHRISTRSPGRCGASWTTTGPPTRRSSHSGDLNERSIAELRGAGAPIDTFGIGTQLVTSLDAPALSGVYKVVELEDGGQRRPIAKFSEGKATFPGVHQVQRVSSGGRLVPDVVALAKEAVPLTEGERAEPLLAPVLSAGRRLRPAAGLASLPPWLLELGEGAAVFEAVQAFSPSSAATFSRLACSQVLSVLTSNRPYAPRLKFRCAPAVVIPHGGARDGRGGQPFRLLGVLLGVPLESFDGPR
jgi:hypothetical protein